LKLGAIHTVQDCDAHVGGTAAGYRASLTNFSLKPLSGLAAPPNQFKFARHKREYLRRWVPTQPETIPHPETETELPC
jgi:hypothetical protein